MHLIEKVPRNTLIFTRSEAGDELWIGLNFSHRKAIVQLNFPENLEIILATHHAEGATFSHGVMALEPDEAVICRKIK